MTLCRERRDLLFELQEQSVKYRVLSVNILLCSFSHEIMTTSLRFHNKLMDL